MENSTQFQYDRAFARNIGLLNTEEQGRLSRSRIGLAGLGGVGGAHLQTLARMGLGAFNLADPDIFEVVNFNRQLGANMSTVGQSKVEVMAQAVREINPDAAVRTFPQGITPENMNAFLDGVDIVVDGIEFFRIEVRRSLYAECRRKGIPVVNAGPIGYGAAVMVFLPGGISFDDYFGIRDGMTRAEMLLAFGLGLGPGLKGHIAPESVDMEREKGPALASACMLCAAAAGTEVLKLIVGRGRVSRAGRGVYFDPLSGRTLALRRRPALTSLRGRVIRWLAFRRIASLRRLHERELQERAGKAGSLNVMANAASV
ncbi:MAG: ThiF family adenylyltransferase [Planctomycetota bacterium]|nr:ThiF family adenylyltransferase [Planctomycetota bacterium]